MSDTEAPLQKHQKPDDSCDAGELIDIRPLTYFNLMIHRAVWEDVDPSTCATPRAVSDSEVARGSEESFTEPDQLDSADHS